MPEDDFTTKFARSMRKVSIHIIVIALAGWIVSGFIFRKPALAGERSHDFGIVEIADAKSSVQHTFHLTNRSGKPIDIRSMKPDCGCTTVNASALQVLPDAAVDIAVTFEVSKHGVKKSLITLDLGDAGTQVLKVQATGRMLPRLFSPLDQVTLVPDMRTGTVEPLIVPVFASVFGSTESPGLSTTSPLGVEIRWSGWHLKHQPRNSSESATEWEGQIFVSRGSGVLSAGSQIEIEMEGAAAPLKFPVIMAQSLNGGAASMPSPAARTETPAAATQADH